MNRKEFLLSMMALGGTALVSSANISRWDEVADRMIAEGIEDSRKGRRKIDPTKAVLMSDIHICGELEDGVPKHYPYNPTSLKLRVAEILSMRRLPAHVLVFGDVAWDYGLEEDYRYASQLLQELMEAGIRVTLALGNHDRRAPFLSVFPEYAKTSPVEGSVHRGNASCRHRSVGFSGRASRPQASSEHHRFGRDKPSANRLVAGVSERPYTSCYFGCTPSVGRDEEPGRSHRQCSICGRICVRTYPSMGQVGAHHPSA